MAYFGTGNTGNCRAVSEGWVGPSEICQRKWSPTRAPHSEQVLLPVAALVIRRSLVWSPWSACRSVLRQDTELQFKYMYVCMNYCKSLWTKASAKCRKCKFNLLCFGMGSQCGIIWLATPTHCFGCLLYNDGGGICWVMCRPFVRACLLGPGRSKTGHLHCICDVWKRSGGTVHYRRQRASAFSEACFGLYSAAIGHRCDIDVTGQRAEQIPALRETLWAHGSGGTRCQSGCFNTRTWSQDTLTSKPKTYLVFTVMRESRRASHSPL